MRSIQAKFYFRNLGPQGRDLFVEAGRATESRQQFLLMRFAPWHCPRLHTRTLAMKPFRGPVDYHSFTRFHCGAPALILSARSSLSSGSFTRSFSGTQCVLVNRYRWPG